MLAKLSDFLGRYTPPTSNDDTSLGRWASKQQKLVFVLERWLKGVLQCVCVCVCVGGVCVYVCYFTCGYSILLWCLCVCIHWAVKIQQQSSSQQSKPAAFPLLWQLKVYSVNTATVIHAFCHGGSCSPCPSVAYLCGVFVVFTILHTPAHLYSFLFPIKQNG